MEQTFNLRLCVRLEVKRTESKKEKNFFFLNVPADRKLIESLVESLPGVKSTGFCSGELQLCSERRGANSADGKGGARCVWGRWTGGNGHQMRDGLAHPSSNLVAGPMVVERCAVSTLPPFGYFSFLLFHDDDVRRSIQHATARNRSLRIYSAVRNGYLPPTHTRTTSGCVVEPPTQTKETT